MIHVFRTSIESEEQVKQVEPVLNELLLHKAEWNFDLEDCDHILRISGGNTDAVEQCSRRLRLSGFICEELSD